MEHVGIPLWILIPLAIALGFVYFKLDKVVAMVKEKRQERERR